MSTVLVVATAWSLLSSFLYGALMVNKVDLRANLYVGMLLAAVLTFVVVFPFGLLIQAVV